MTQHQRNLKILRMTDPIGRQKDLQACKSCTRRSEDTKDRGWGRRKCRRPTRHAPLPWQASTQTHVILRLPHRHELRDIQGLWVHVPHVHRKGHAGWQKHTWIPTSAGCLSLSALASKAAFS